MTGNRFLYLVIFIVLSKAGAAMALEITSEAFTHGAAIPEQYTCSGENISPRLSWKNIPAGTKSFVLICEDPDAPMGTWVHWVIYNIPGENTFLSENIPAEIKLPDGTLQGSNDFHRIGYGGPCPPPGPPHRYFFKLYALDTQLDLAPGKNKKEVISAIKGHILDTTKLMGTFRR